MIVIVDYGMGNLGSITNMLKRIGRESMITSDIDKIESADKLILPGVGAFDNAVINLKHKGLFDIVKKVVVKDRKPVLGICLGLQLLTQRSEEGRLEGLGLIDAETVKFKFSDSTMKVPHMGWNTVDIVNASPLFKDAYKDTRFYFVHSYYAKCKDPKNIVTTTHYGLDFCSSFSKDNIYAVQFHPEKSHKFGMKLLSNFVECC